jgi:hypothetical protein
MGDYMRVSLKTMLGKEKDCMFNLMDRGILDNFLMTKEMVVELKYIKRINIKECILMVLNME